MTVLDDVLAGESRVHVTGECTSHAARATPDSGEHRIRIRPFRCALRRQAGVTGGFSSLSGWRTPIRCRRLGKPQRSASVPGGPGCRRAHSSASSPSRSRHVSRQLVTPDFSRTGIVSLACTQRALESAPFPSSLVHADPAGASRHLSSIVSAPVPVSGFRLHFQPEKR